MMRHKKATPKKAREYKPQPVRGDKYALLPPAIVEGKFLVGPEGYVYAWRVRAGQKPGWYKCEVRGVEPNYVSLWDTVLQQYFCFDPTAKEIPDVRIIE